MARLLYLSNISLDGYIADAQGRFDWSEPSAEVHQYINDVVRATGTHLYGRRNYEVMTFWETVDDDDPVMRDFARIWQATSKIVYSRTLERPTSARTRIERELDPEAVRSLVDGADRDVLVGGAQLAGQALAAGLVDELHLFVSPVVIGGGTRCLPDDVRIDLELIDEHRFDNGVVHLHYRVVR
ncbi:MAG: deaminase [Aeromicrobium sp.]|jgi:dihydrofolate reductase|nr:deaminase [Aeromicrobium sp.]